MEPAGALERSAAGAAAALGAARVLLRREGRQSSRRALLAGSLGVLTCFFAGTRLEYINVLRGKRVRALSPGGLFYLGGFYSLGALSGALAARALSFSAAARALSPARPF